MKIIITILALTVFSLGHTQFISEDDLLHGAVGTGISATTYAIIYSKTKNLKKTFWYSLGISTLAGLSKEVYDGYIIKGQFDTGEAVATISGGLIASYTFNIFTRKKRKRRKKREYNLSR